MPPLKRVACVTSHPIQYHAHWFRALAAEPGITFEVFYCHKATPNEQAAAGFGVEFDWDVSLLDGYQYRFLINVATRPEVASFGGLDTPEVAQIFSTRAFDAVIINGWHYKSAWQTLLACWRHKIPVMVRSDSHLKTKRSSLKRLMKEIPYRWFIGKLDACLAVGQWSQEYFLHYGALPDRIFMVPHTVSAISDEVFHSMSARRNEFRDRWGVRPDDVLFVFAGKFIDKKRPVDFVRAVGKAKALNQKITGLMVGDGPLRLECERIAQELRAPIHFAGFLNQSEIPAAYVAADALVLPSDGGETWGLVVNEAMNWGRACIVSDQVGCGPDLVLAGVTGFSYPLGNIGALADRMVECAEMPNQLAAMGKYARVRQSTYSTQSAVEGVAQAVARVTRAS